MVLVHNTDNSRMPACPVAMRTIFFAACSTMCRRQLRPKWRWTTCNGFSRGPGMHSTRFREGNRACVLMGQAKRQRSIMSFFSPKPVMASAASTTASSTTDPSPPPKLRSLFRCILLASDGNEPQCQEGPRRLHRRLDQALPFKPRGGLRRVGLDDDAAGRKDRSAGWACRHSAAAGAARRRTWCSRRWAHR